MDSIDPGSDITWPNAINPDFFKNYPFESQMRSWPWPGTSSTPPPLQNDYSDTEESAYEKVQRENIMEKEKRLAEFRTDISDSSTILPARCSQLLISS